MRRSAESSFEAQLGTMVFQTSASLGRMPVFGLFFDAHVIGLSQGWRHSEEFRAVNIDLYQEIDMRLRQVVQVPAAIAP